MLYTLRPYDNMLYMPVFIDPFGSPVFEPRRRRKLKGWQKARRK